MNNKKQHEVVFDYEASWLSRLFAKHGQYKIVAVGREQFWVKGSVKQQSIEYEAIDGDIGLEKGLFWSMLTVPYKGDSIKIGGIKNAAAPVLLSQITRVSARYQQEYVQALQPVLLRACVDLQGLLSQHSYIRQSSVDRWFAEHGHLSAIIDCPALSRLAGRHQRDVAVLRPVLTLKATYFKECNDRFVKSVLNQYQDFFNSVESQPLTQRQREACVINEQSNLVLAGAGTGKTSVMVGRAGYLLQSKQALPSEILMLAYASDAKDEMAGRIKKRLGVNDLTVKTFHSLGKEIITQVEGVVPAVNKMAEDDVLKAQFIDEQFKQLMQSSDTYQSNIIQYFVKHAYPYKSLFNFKSFADYVQYIHEHEVRTLKGELVKSLEECEIANYLAQQGIVYEYEAQYKVGTKGPDYKQYQPDFYLPEYDIYIEHFAVDEQNNTPAFIDRKKYVDGMLWKRNLHQENETTLIETFSYQKAKGTLLSALEQALLDAGVTFKPVSKLDLLGLLNKEMVSMLSKLLAQLLSLIKASLLTIQDLYAKAKQSSMSDHMMAIIKLFEPIYNAYEEALKRSKTIDFDDMIARAITYINNGQFQSGYQHILVDEFQDISSGRAQLVKALIRQQASTLFCVGDDWQSIYRFSGSDLSITNHFAHHFGNTATSVLDRTFRFNNKIGEVAARFVTQNPTQLKKEIESLHQVEHTAVSLISALKTEDGLSAALDRIAEQVSQKVSVLVLVRFSHDKPKVRALNAQYQHLEIKAMTTHAAKGKEADYVVVVGLTQGKFGFPSEKTNHPLLNLLLPDSEQFQHAEERRLFYVALTRAKHHVYLVVDANKPSVFIRELIKDGYAIDADSLKAFGLQEALAPACPKCESGSLIKRDGQYSQFHGCSHYPICDYTQSACAWCSGALVTKGRFRVCEKATCQYVEPICPVCHAKMVYRKSAKFWGCSQFRSDSAFSCGHTERYIDLKQAKKA